MELTDEILTDLGFTKSTSRGGAEYWYHNIYIGDIIIGYKGGIFESGNKLAFDPDRPESVKTLKELFEIMHESFRKAYTEQGENNLAANLRDLLKIENDGRR